MIDFYSSLPHYADHLAPIHAALDGLGLAGDWCSPSGEWGVKPARDWWRADRLCVVASWQDVTRLNRHRRLVYVEHGAGQTYVDRAGHQAYSGGGRSHPGRVVGYVAPSETVAARWRAARPGVAVVSVGCPRLDAFHVARPDARTVAVTFHWPSAICPEAGSALKHYEDRLGALCGSWRAAGWTVLGHAHPRARGHLWAVWRRFGVEPEPDAGVVLGSASVLVADNTSLMYEMAALGRPVIALNAPWYRRHVHHGLRFWDHVPGLQVDGPDELAAVDLDAYVAAGGEAGLRRSAAGFVYAHLDGTASRRAADFLVELERGTHDGVPHVRRDPQSV